MKLTRRRSSRRSSSTTSELLESRSYLSAAVSFATRTDITVGNGPVAIAAGDFTNDGHQDLAVADSVNKTVQILVGQGAGAFTLGAVLTLSGTPTQIITGDFNGDGLPDLAVASSPIAGGTTVTVFLNEGNDTWALGQATTVETGVGNTEPIAIAAGNFNGDGHLDIAATEYSAGDVAILLGTGTGTFAAPVVYNVGTDPAALTVADYNNDGNEDVAVANGAAVNVLYGTGTGTFTAGSVTAVGGTGATSIVTAYLSGDAKPDLVVGGSDGGITLLTNNGGSFTTASTATAAGGVSGLAVADFNLDGDTDVAAVDGGTSFLPGADDVSVVTGSPAGTNAGVTNFPTGSYPQSIAVADFNGDGKPDIAVTDEGAGTVSILINNTAVTPIVVTNAVTLSSATTSVGSAVAITAALTTASVSPVTGETTPTGTVDFYDGTTLLGTTQIAAGAATAVFTTTTLAVGQHKLSATYEGDTVYALSHAPAVTETITGITGDTPVLQATVVADSLPYAVAPGASGVLKIRITNAGNAVAQGTLTNLTYLSLDQTLDANDSAVTVKGALGSSKINLKPDNSIILSGTFTVPAGLASGSYYPLVFVDATSSFTPTTSDQVVSGSATDVVPDFGSVGGKANVRYSLGGLGSGSTTATFSLNGPGTGAVNVGDAGLSIVLSGTTARSAVTITTRGGAVSFDNLTASSAVGSVSATTGTFTGSLTFAGGIAVLKTAAMTGANIIIGTGAVSTLSLGSVTSSIVTAAGGIKSLATTGWTGGSLSAAYANTLSSTGNFTPVVAISGTGAPHGVALGSVVVKGTVDTSDWIVGGNVSSISIANVPAGWDASVAGTVKSLSVSGDFAGSIGAAGFSLVLIRGDLTGEILAGAGFGADGRPGGGDDTYAAGSIGTIHVIGSASGAVIGAGVTPVTGGYSVLPGGSIKSLTIGVDADSTSRFLAAALPAKVKIGRATIEPAGDPRFVGVS